MARKALVLFILLGCFGCGPDVLDQKARATCIQECSKFGFDFLYESKTCKCCFYNAGSYVCEPVDEVRWRVYD